MEQPNAGSVPTSALPNEDGLYLTDDEIEELRLRCLHKAPDAKVEVEALFAIRLICDWRNLRAQLDALVQDFGPFVYDDLGVPQSTRPVAP